MNTQKRSMVPAATLLAALMLGALTTGKAQNPPSHDKTPQHREGMKDMKDMSTMHGPHHVLAMAHRDNVATFARALRGHVAQSKAVNLDLARPAVSEMKRSFDQMKQHHQAQMTMMGGQMKPAMSDKMKQMETHSAALSAHLTALESEVNATSPDPKKVSEHTTEILKQCAQMSGMPAKAKQTK